MSQAVVLALLKELGGTASQVEISQLAKARYPNDALHTYIERRLNALKKKGDVTVRYEKRNGRSHGIWSIVA